MLEDDKHASKRTLGVSAIENLKLVGEFENYSGDDSMPLSRLVSSSSRRGDAYGYGRRGSWGVRGRQSAGSL